MLGRQPSLQRRQGDIRMGRNMGRQGGLLLGRQLARPVTAPRAGAHLPGPPPPDQCLVDVRHADPKNRCRRPRSIAAEPVPADPPNSSAPAAKPSQPPTSCGWGSESHFCWSGNRFQRFQPIRLCSSVGSKPRPCCPPPRPRPCCSGPCSPPVRSSCVKSTDGRPSPRTSPIIRLTLLPDPISSPDRRPRQTNSNTNRDGICKGIRHAHCGSTRVDCGK